MKIKIYLAVYLLLLPALFFGQESRATLTGVVTDSSGAVVPGATVIVRNVDTGEETRGTTTGQGAYTIPFLRPGNYHVTVEASGFKRYSREHITLQVAQTTQINVAMEVGALTETVQVTAEAPLLDTAKADRGGLINTQQLSELPINGRNPFLLGAMIPGVNFHGAAIWQRPFDNGAIADWTINGGQARGTEFLMDGAPNNSQMGENNIAYVPPVDSVAEFRIQTNSYDAQYGHTNGGIINVSTKSGTNELHGTVYGFYKRADWAANSFQNNGNGRPKTDTKLDNQGFQVAGPVIFPKLFDGRNKLFFMVNYEDWRENWPQVLTLSVPQPEFLTGDFSKLVDANGRQIRIFDPLTATAENGYTRTQFPGNIIPPSRISQTALNILKTYPAPNNVAPGQIYGRNNYYNSENFAVDRFYNLLFKFDANIGDKHRMFFRHASNDRTEHRNENGVIDKPGECCQLPFQRINDHVTADWVSTLTPSVILNVRGSYNRFIEKSNSFIGQDFDARTLGLPASLIDQLPVTGHYPRIELRGAFDYPNLGRYPGGNTTNTYAIHPNLTLIKGAHTLKMGWDYRFTQYSRQDRGDVLRLRADRRYTRERFDVDDTLSGHPIASLLIGGISEGEVNYRQLPIYGNKYSGIYLQDDWKVTRRLTLNLGLRWDLNTPPVERFGRSNGIFDPTIVPNYASLVSSANLAGPVKGGLTFLGANGQTSIAKFDKNNFQPRIGAAYQVTNKIVARGGWGIYFINPNNNWAANDTVFLGFDQTSPVVNSVDGGRTLLNTLANPLPGGVIAPRGAAGGANTFLNRDIAFFDQNFVTPYVHQFSAGLQFELPYSSMVEISYVGSRTMKLQTEWDGLNEPNAAFRKLCNPFEGGDPNFCNQQVANPFKNIEAFRGTTLFSADTISRYQANRPFPQFNRIRTRGDNSGQIWYNALQIQHNTRFRGGVTIMSGFTWSKQIERWGYTDQANRITQQSPYVWDRPWRVTFTPQWQLPFGRGKKFLANSNGVVNRVVGGWEINAFFSWDAGRPWDLPSNVYLVGDPKVKDVNWNGHQVRGASPCVAQYQNASRSFVLQPYAVAAGCTAPVWLFAPDQSGGSAYTFGRITPSRSGQIRLHSAPNLDMSINKKTMITERFTLQFRAEAFNATNTYYYGRTHFINNPTDPNFGTLFPRDATDQNRYPRQIQLGLKLLF